MTTRADLVSTLSDTVAEVLQLEALAPGTDLIESGLLDSFGLVNLLFAMEEQFGVNITVKDLDSFDFHSVEGMASFLESRLA